MRRRNKWEVHEIGIFVLLAIAFASLLFVVKSVDNFTGQFVVDVQEDLICECDGGIKFIELQTAFAYTGGSVIVEARAANKNQLDSTPYGIDVEVFNGTTLSSDTYSGAVAITKIASNGTQARITFKVNATKIGKDKLDSNTDFRVTFGGVEHEERIHVSCSQPIGPPFTFEEFELISYIDRKNNVCEQCGDSDDDGVCDDEDNATCGNNIVEDSEECDDGNVVNGDGCSSTCQIEINETEEDESCEYNVTSAFYDKICDSIYNLTLELLPAINESTVVKVYDKDNHFIESHAITPTNKTFVTNVDHPETKFVVMGTSYEETIHTSCSQPIGPGFVFDEFLVVDWNYVPKAEANVTALVNVKDGNYKEVDKNKWFGVEFEGNLTNNDTISIYLLEKEASNVYLCDYGEKNCDYPGLGAVYTDGEGWYNITIVGLVGETNKFNLDPSPKIRFDYFKGVSKSCKAKKPKLNINKLDYPDPVYNGTLLNYSILLNNTGEGAADNVTVVENYPGEVIYVSASPAPISGNNTWLINEIENGTSFEINITVLVKGNVANGTVINNFVNATYWRGNKNETINDTEDTLVLVNVTPVVEVPELIILKTDNPDPVYNGSLLDYTLFVFNTGNEPADNFTVTENYPTEVDYISASPTPTTGNNTWLISQLDNGSSMAINITVQVKGGVGHGTTITNLAKVEYDNGTANVTVNDTENTLVINVVTPINRSLCCCALDVSSTPEVVGQNEKVLIAADISNLFSGLVATPADITDANVSIYYVDNGTEVTVVDSVPMTYLSEGLWYYEFFTENNTPGTYIASVTMLTNQTDPFVKEASDAFVIGETGGSGLTITGVSADLVNLNESLKLAAEVKFNGIAIDASLLTAANLTIEMINGTTQVYTLNDSLQKADGLIYLDGAFNETGVYYLDWMAEYQNKIRTAREIVVVVDWGDKLDNISVNVSVNVSELIDLILESRQYLLELITDIEQLQSFNEEEVFLITDSVNSMTQVVDYLDQGKISEAEAEQEFDLIRTRLNDQLGDKLTGSVIAEGLEDEPVVKDWRNLMFLILLLIFGVCVLVVVLLLKLMKRRELIDFEDKEEGATSSEITNEGVKKPAKRRYIVIYEKLRSKFKREEEDEE